MILKLTCLFEKILVVQDMDINSDLAIGSPKLLADLDRGRAYVRDIAKRYGVLQFKDIRTATEYCIDEFAVMSKQSNSRLKRKC